MDPSWLRFGRRVAPWHTPASRTTTNKTGVASTLSSPELDNGKHTDVALEGPEGHRGAGATRDAHRKPPVHPADHLWVAARVLQERARAQRESTFSRYGRKSQFSEHRRERRHRIKPLNIQPFGPSLPRPLRALRSRAFASRSVGKRREHPRSSVGHANHLVDQARPAATPGRIGTARNKAVGR